MATPIYESRIASSRASFHGEDLGEIRETRYRIVERDRERKLKKRDRDGKFDKRRAVITDYTRWDAGSVRNVKGARKGINGGNAKINSERPTYRRDG